MYDINSNLLAVIRSRVRVPPTERGVSPHGGPPRSVYGVYLQKLGYLDLTAAVDEGKGRLETLFGAFVVAHDNTGGF